MAIAISGVRVWDGHASETPRERVTIRVEDGRLTGIQAAPDLAADAERYAFDAASGEPGGPSGARGAAGGAGGGPTAIPGLIDAHVHMTLDPAIVGPRKQLAPASKELEAALCARAQAMLRAGITTARDLGGGGWSELALRDRIARGDVPGPRLLCAGQPITSRRGHCFFWGGEADSADEIRRVVRRQVDHGADWIKVMATGGIMTRTTGVAEAQFDQPALAALVAEAHAHGRPVAAHCHGTAGIRNAARAGARTIEHCSFAGAGGFGADLDDAVVLCLAGREALWSSPTVNAGWARRREKDGQETDFARRMDACFRRLRSAGVPLIASTDAGIPGVPHHGLARALPVFARYAGLAPVEALRCATSEAARALGLDGETGALRCGLAADLVVVDGDPLRDLDVLTRPLLVVARGRVVRGDDSTVGSAWRWRGSRERRVRRGRQFTT